MNERAKWTRQICRGALQEPNGICAISCDLFFASDSMDATNIVNWNHFDCVVTHTVRLYAPVESAVTITGGHWREYAWLKICTCESIIGFTILRDTTGGDAKKCSQFVNFGRLPPPPPFPPHHPYNFILLLPICVEVIHFENLHLPSLSEISIVLKNKHTIYKYTCKLEINVFR